MTGTAFIKMHGLGNDFVVVDARTAPLHPYPDWVRAVADRRTGVGCDQVVILEPPRRDPETDIYMRLFNADGGEVSACGNASRCVAALTRGLSDRVRIGTRAGALEASVDADGEVTVDMGPAQTDWQAIPLATAVDTLHLPLEGDPVGVGMGNPHAVFFVDDPDKIGLTTLGPSVEHHPLFPERTNVEIVRVEDQRHLRMRVWERGVGITRACGTGACAALVAAHRRGLTGRSATVELDGGPLEIVWRDDGHVLMTGPVATSFSGVLSQELSL